MKPEIFGILVDKLIGILLMIAVIYMAKVNPKLREKKIWRFSITQFAYTLIV